MSNILINQFINRSIRKAFFRHCRNLSGNVAFKEKPLQEQQNEQQNQNILKKSEKLTQMNAKEVSKKPQRLPFIKNIFLGKFDTEILTYPEALNKEAVEQLEQAIQSVQFYYDNTSGITKKEFIEGAKQLKLFGLQASQLAGGRELNITESCRFNEVIAQRSSDVQLLNSEQAGQALIKFGNEKQIGKYLQGVINGNITMGLCVGEELGWDPSAFKANASFDANRKVWVLNGKKLHVINGDTADLFVVLAKTKLFVSGLNETDVSAFLVERTFGGVSSKPSKSLGLDQSSIADVIFENTHIPEENVLGKENKGMDIYSQLLPEIQLMNSVASLTIARKSFNQFLDHCKATSTRRNKLIETDIVCEKISDFTSKIYAMESMIYLTAGLLDIYEQQDCSIECSVTKTFSAEHTSQITFDIMQFIGPDAYSTDHWANISHREAVNYLLFNGTLDNAKIIIALQGLQHAGIHLQDLIKRIRNPLFHTTEVFKRMWTQRKHRQDNPSLTLQLSGYLHPSAMPAAEWLEYSVLRVQYATELMLAHYGHDVVTKHTDLKRLAECVIDIYAMVAALGRASRSYCIGLSHADFDILQTSAFCHRRMFRVKANIRMIEDGPFLNNDVVHGKVAERIGHVGKYYAEHPLARNF